MTASIRVPATRNAPPTAMPAQGNNADPDPPPMNQPSGTEFAEKSSLYQEFLAERDEILRHKWLESEKLGRDIGFERALLDWIRKHRDKWRQSRRNAP